jgi:hypothetical protein
MFNEKTLEKSPKEIAIKIPAEINKRIYLLYSFGHIFAFCS